MQQDSVTSLFQLMRYKMLALGNAMLKNDDDVEDALQDAFCRVWRRREMIRDDKNAGAYVLSTMHNVCIDTIRGRNADAYVQIESLPDIEFEEQGDDNDEKEIYNDVISIINAELSEVQRRILQMRDIKGMSYGDIAQIMNMEETAVRMALSRARKTVRNIYRKRYE